MKHLSLLTICAAVMVAYTAHVRADEVAPSAGLESYIKARKVLDDGIAAIGGAKALNVLRTVRRDIIDKTVDGGQAQHPRLDPPDAQDAPGNIAFSNDEVLAFLDYAGNRSYIFDKTVAFAPEIGIQIDVVTPDYGFETNIYAEEKPFYEVFPAGSLLPLRTRSLRRYPEGALRMALARPETLSWIGVGAEGGHAQDVISFTDATGTRVLLYFDAKTHLLSKSETLRGHPFFGDTSTEVLYVNYRRVGPLMLPTRIVDRTGGRPTHFISIKSTAIDASLPEERFQPPKDYVAVEPSLDEPTLEKVSDGLYIIRGNYNLMFAVFRDYVMAFEAPLNSTYAEKCLALVRATAPGKPIRYLLSTHYHYDHIAGVKPFIEAGTTIITTPDAKAIIEGLATASSSMRPDYGPRTTQTPIIETVSDQRIFDDGTERVEIYDVGPAPHVAQMLVAYFPKEKLVYVADLVDIPSSKQVIVGVDTAPMQNRLTAQGREVERVVPVHGVPVTGAEYRQGFATRAKYVH